MMFPPYKLPNNMNPDYMRGFIEGFEACRYEIKDYIDLIKPFHTETGTAEANDDASQV